LKELGVNEFSINIEIFNREIAKKVMRKKYDLGTTHYLDFLESSAEIVGGNKMRSMLMVGLEPMEDTLAGVRAIAERGCVPVLSPFRPDPATPMRDASPPTADFMRETYLRAHEITTELGTPLGPSCIPCGHNTLSFATELSGDAYRFYAHPNMI
jgi:biotin synthase-related radical SAM superfamily protein